MKCLILAGGFATRLWPLSEKRAKPLLHLKDRPLISHIAERLPDDLEVIISTNAAFVNDFEAWKKTCNRAVRIVNENSHSDEGKLGALGATAQVIREGDIKEDLLLIAGDNYFGFDLKKFIGHFNGNPLLAACDIGDLNAAKKFGVVVKKDGHVAEFQEKPEHPKSTLVSTGCYIIPAKNLADVVSFAKEKPDNIGGIFEHLKEKGETIGVFGFTEPWYDIGSFEAYLQANQDLLQGETIVEPGAKMENTQCGGGNFIGKGARIKNSKITDCVILDGCDIEDCVLRECVIDENCVLKGIDLSHQMIRAGSWIHQ